MATTDDVKKLRDRTGISVMQCKQALDEANGDFDKALRILEKKGAGSAAKKASRELGAGTVAAYVHANKEMAGVVLLQSETDFVAKNEEFARLAYDIAMHVAAANPEDIVALLEQPFIKDPEKTIRNLIDTATQKFGERIEITEARRISVR